MCSVFISLTYFSSLVVLLSCKQSLPSLLPPIDATKRSDNKPQLGFIQHDHDERQVSPIREYSLSIEGVGGCSIAQWIPLAGPFFLVGSGGRKGGRMVVRGYFMHTMVQARREVFFCCIFCCCYGHALMPVHWGARDDTCTRTVDTTNIQPQHT